jgi:hypothetical protein
METFATAAPGLILASRVGGLDDGTEPSELTKETAET